MIFTTALIFVLAISSTSANEAKVEKLMDQINNGILADIVKVTEAAKAHNASMEELKKQVQDIVHRHYILAKPLIKELKDLGGTARGLADNLAFKIRQDKELHDLLKRAGAEPKYGNKEMKDRMTRIGKHVIRRTIDSNRP